MLHVGLSRGVRHGPGLRLHPVQRTLGSPGVPMSALFKKPCRWFRWADGLGDRHGVSDSAVSTRHPGNRFKSRSRPKRSRVGPGTLHFNMFSGDTEAASSVAKLFWVMLVLMLLAVVHILNILDQPKHQTSSPWPLLEMQTLRPRPAYWGCQARYPGAGAGLGHASPWPCSRASSERWVSPLQAMGV